jgi:hypothetical protein
VERRLERGRADHPGSVATELLDVAKKPHPDREELLLRAFTAFIDDAPPALAVVGTHLRDSFDALPRELLRRGAERALQRPSDRAGGWAVEQLLGPLFDRARDGAQADFAARLHADDRLRSLVELRAPKCVIPLTRPLLGQGRLRFPSAAALVKQITTLWPTEAAGDKRGLRRRPRRAPPDIAAKKKALTPFFKGRAHQGPMTDAEWEQLRIARDSVPRSELSWPDALELLQPGVRTPADQRLIDDAMAAAREGKNDLLQLLIPDALLVAPRPEDLEILDELMDVTTEWARHVLDAQKIIRSTFGLPASEPRLEPPGARDVEDEWMDRTD